MNEIFIFFFMPIILYFALLWKPKYGESNKSAAPIEYLPPIVKDSTAQ